MFHLPIDWLQHDLNDIPKYIFPKCIFPKSFFSKGISSKFIFKCIFFKCIFPKCIYPKCIFVKCTRLACLLSFASLFSNGLNRNITLSITIVGSSHPVAPYIQKPGWNFKKSFCGTPYWAGPESLPWRESLQEQRAWKVQVWEQASHGATFHIPRPSSPSSPTSSLGRELWSLPLCTGQAVRLLGH